MSVALAAQLREGTKKSHTMAENTGFVSCFLKGVVDKASYRKLVADLYFVYSAMEEEITKLADHPVVGPIAMAQLNRREALVQGGKTRFRPVVLTAMTTALGLVPLSIGMNFDFFGLYGSLNPELYWGGEQAAWWGPMAVAIIAGILFAIPLSVPILNLFVPVFGVAAFTHLFHRIAMR